MTRDLAPAATGRRDCAADIGTHPMPAELSAGEVRLCACKRLRPLTLRADVGDTLRVRVHNDLRSDDGDGRPGCNATFRHQSGEIAGTEAR